MNEGAAAPRVVVGRIMRPWGIKGWLKVVSFTDPPENLFSYRPWSCRCDGEWRELPVASYQPQAKGWVVKIAGIEDRSVAERLVTPCDVWVQRARLRDLPVGEYYWDDLVGLDVSNRRGLYFGRVVRLLETGANDVLVVAPAPDSVDGRERLIPYLPARVVLDVDLAAGRLMVDWEAEY